MDYKKYRDNVMNYICLGGGGGGHDRPGALAAVQGVQR